MRKLIFILSICAWLHANPSLANVYVVFYMTLDGTTGHVGIAIDNYKVLVRSKVMDGVEIRKEETHNTGDLSFFDLWPEKEVRYGRFNRNTEPYYFKLPRTTAEAKITVETLLYRGLPHRYRRPCDALVSITTTPKEDAELLEFIHQLSEKRPYYNARKYNCADFVCLCLQQILKRKIKAREFVPMSMISTPNKLFRRLKKMPNRVEVLRDPGSKANGSFIKERILKNKA